MMSKLRVNTHDVQSTRSLVSDRSTYDNREIDGTSFREMSLHCNSRTDKELNLAILGN